MRPNFERSVRQPFYQLIDYCLVFLFLPPNAGHMMVTDPFSGNHFPYISLLN